MILIQFEALTTEHCKLWLIVSSWYSRHINWNYLLFPALTSILFTKEEAEILPSSIYLQYHAVDKLYRLSVKRWTNCSQHQTVLHKLVPTNFLKHFVLICNYVGYSKIVSIDHNLKKDFLSENGILAALLFSFITNNDKQFLEFFL